VLRHSLLRSEGRVPTRKRTDRLYTAWGLPLRRRQRRKRVRPRLAMTMPERPNERWSADFLHDPLAHGRRIRSLNRVDDYARFCIGPLVDVGLSGASRARWLDEIIERRGRPGTLLLDKGPQMTRKALFFWSHKSSVKRYFIQPGRPTQNAFIERFNGRFRDGYLNQHWFRDLADAQRLISVGRAPYHPLRPPSSLSYKTPATFAQPVP
jgi:putative transposase